MADRPRNSPSVPTRLTPEEIEALREDKRRAAERIDQFLRERRAPKAAGSAGGQGGAAAPEKNDKR
ncbi:MAG: hypothetical protein ACM30I_03235 [Gemmatimonas sp.]